MQRDELYLADIVEAADAIKTFLENAKEQEFAGHDLLRSAVLQKLIVIGEAAGRVSGHLRKRYSQIPWIDIVAFRNIAVHAYFSVNWPIVWTTATEEVPALRAQVTQILEDIRSGDKQ